MEKDMETKDPALTKTPITDTNDTTETAARAETANVKVADDRANHEDIEDNTTINKGTDTFEEDIVETQHVNDDDNPARQPDRRDQQGSSPFDGNINEDTMGSEGEKSEEITDMNRYASVDNAQSRILNPDEKDPD